MSEDGKTRYIIEIKYAHDKKGENVEMVDITSNDIQWSMKEYQRNRQPFEWRIKHDYGKGL
tara:strand:+ start:111 stop:293 length:183 start_codon:yes stop_codon:yes gene_type:complete